MDNAKENRMIEVNNSYGKIDFTSIHFHISEMLSGHEKDSTDRFFKAVNYTLPFDYDNCRMIVTGLPQNLYKHLFNWQQSEAAQFFVFEYKKTMDLLLSQYGYRGLSIIFLFDGRKHYVTLFTPCSNKSKNPWEMAGRINRFLQEKYLEMNHSDNIQAWNITALSPVITDYNQIAEQFEKCKELVKLSWFIQNSQVIDQIWVENHQLKTDKILLIRRLHTVLNQVFETDLNKTAEDLALLFEQAGQILDFHLIQDMLSMCKDTMNDLIMTYNLKYPTNLENLCRISTYLYYSQCSREVRHTILNLLRQILEHHKIYSPLTKKIISLLHNNYHKPITIQIIADQIHASPNYCSSLFKKETGTTINEALTQLRLDKAKQLMLQEDLKIKEIASLCGFGSARYFSEIFAHYFNISPLSWKKQHRNNL